MSERPILAIALSVVVHGAILAGASSIRAGQLSHPGQLSHSGQRCDSGQLSHSGQRCDATESSSAHSATEDTVAGLYGNTIEIDRLVEGTLGAGSRGEPDPTSPASEPAAPAATTAPPKPTALPQPTAAPPPAQPARTPSDETAPATPTPSPPASAAPASSARTDPDASPAKPRKRRGGARTGAKRAGAGHHPEPNHTGGDGDAAGDGAKHGTNQGDPNALLVAGSITHVIPLAFSANKLWHELDFGVVAKGDVDIEVTDGKITGTTYPSETPKLIRRIIDGALVMLRARPVRLTLATEASGTERLSVMVVLSEREVSDAEREGAAEKPILQMSDVSPTLDAAGNANFTFATGRHVEVRVALRR